MQYKALVEFLESKMSMSHIYQPVMLMTLLDSGGRCNQTDIAKALLSRDQSQIEYYTKITNNMVGRVLRKHGIVERDRATKTYNLVGYDDLTPEQRATIKMLCEQRLEDFEKKRGKGLWDYRLMDTDPVPDSLRYRVLKTGGQRCALCGATKEERPLDIDHIIPRSRGGKNEFENLQILCSKCNRTKGNKDTTDFRPDPAEVAYDCVFCTSKRIKKPQAANGLVVAILDKYPVTKGHTLVIPKRHTVDYFSMTEQERHDAEDLLRMLRNQLTAKDPAITGFNMGTNCGEDAGQTVMHAHIHLIPRRKGDVKNPRGGVRGVIPTKQGY